MLKCLRPELGDYGRSPRLLVLSLASATNAARSQARSRNAAESFSIISEIGRSFRATNWRIQRNCLDISSSCWWRLWKTKAKHLGRKPPPPPSLLLHFSLGSVQFYEIWPSAYSKAGGKRLPELPNDHVKSTWKQQQSPRKALGLWSDSPNGCQCQETPLRVAAAGDQPAQIRPAVAPTHLRVLSTAVDAKYTHGICAQEENSPCCSDVLRNSRGKKCNDAFQPRVVKNDLLRKIGVRSSGEVLS